MEKSRRDVKRFSQGNRTASEKLSQCVGAAVLSSISLGYKSGHDAMGAYNKVAHAVFKHIETFGAEVDETELVHYTESFGKRLEPILAKSG